MKYYEISNLFFQYLNNNEFELAYNLCDKLLKFEEFDIKYTIKSVNSNYVEISLFNNNNNEFIFTIDIQPIYDSEFSIANNNFGYKETEIIDFYLEYNIFIDQIFDKFQFFIESEISNRISNNDGF